jgi:ATP-binding cassette, subfamily C (CFTR/MRP), member 1
LIEFDDPYTLLSTDSAFNKLYTYSVTEEDPDDTEHGEVDLIMPAPAPTLQGKSQ